MSNGGWEDETSLCHQEHDLEFFIDEDGEFDIKLFDEIYEVIDGDIELDELCHLLNNPSLMSSEMRVLINRELNINILNHIG